MIDTSKMMTHFNNLPEKQKECIYNLILTIDTDENDLTPEEAAGLDEAIQDIQAGRIIPDNEIDWDNIGKTNG